MSAPKFNFIPERQLNKIQSETVFHVSIYPTGGGSIVFPKLYVDINEMDGKFVRLFCDVDKKVIGWKIIEGKTSLGELDDCRQIKKSSLGVARLGITKLLDNMGIKIIEKVKLPVKLHKSSVLDGEMSYVELPTESKDSFTLNGVKQ